MVELPENFPEYSIMYKTLSNQIKTLEESKSNAIGKEIEEIQTKIEKYEAEIKTAPPEIQGKTYPQLYNIKTHKRTEEYDRLYDEVIEELIQMGVPLR